MSSEPLSRRAWLIVALLWFVGAFNYFDRVMLASMRESVLASIPMSETQFGLLTSIFFWVYGVLSPFAGYLADRFSRSRVVVASLVAWSALTWLTGHARTFPELLLARGLMGISEACYIPASLALIADYHRGRTRSLATGLHMTGIMVGSALGGLGGVMAERHGWSYAFVLFGKIGVLYGVLLVLFLRDAPVADPSPASRPNAEPVRLRPAVASLFGDRNFGLLLTYWGFLGIIGAVLIGWMPTFLEEHFHLSEGAAGISATGYQQAAALGGLVLGGAWADRWSRSNPRGRMLVPAIGLCVAGPGILLTAHTPLIAFALLGLVLYGLAGAFANANMMPILCLVADRRYRATGYGLLNLCSCVAGGTAVYAAGALRDRQIDLSWILGVSAVIAIGCAGLLLLVKPRQLES